MWRWRYQLKNIFANPHLSLPLWFAAVAIVSTLLSGLNDRSLLLALPALAMTLVMGVNRFPNAATGDMLTTVWSQQTAIKATVIR